MLPHKDVDWKEWGRRLAQADSFPKLAEEVELMMSSVVVTHADLDGVVSRMVAKFEQSVEANSLANREEMRIRVAALDEKFDSKFALLSAAISANTNELKALVGSSSNELKAEFYKSRLEGRWKLIGTTVAITAAIIGLLGLVARYVPWSTLFS